MLFPRLLLLCCVVCRTLPLGTKHQAPWHHTPWHQASNTLRILNLSRAILVPLTAHGEANPKYTRNFFLRICVTWGRPRGALGAMLGCPLGPGGAQEVSRGAPKEPDVKGCWVSPRFIDRSDAPGATASVSATRRRAGQPRFHNCIVSAYKCFVSVYKCL